MKLIGLTGGIGTGKTTASEILRGLGARIVDADEISRAATAANGPALPAIRGFFGYAVFQPDGTLDRRALARRVFSDPLQKTALEAIIHPLVVKEIEIQIESARKDRVPVLVLCVPLLFETGMEVMCDETWLLTLPSDEQTARVMKRDGLSMKDAFARIDSQLPQDERVKRADIAIDNSGTREELAQKLEELYRRLLARK